MANRTGFYIEFMHKKTALISSRCLRPDNQVSISVRINVGNISNKYSYVGLSCFGWRCSVLVLCLARPHLVFFAKLHGVVMSQKSMIFLWRVGQNVIAC